jgi:hypothetical protein
MKANLQKLIGTALLGLALFSSSIPAWAGQKSLPEVTIGTNFARGSTAGARYSADSKQYIGCDFETANGPSVTCSAQDKTGKYFVCFAYGNARWATVAKAITDFSYISLQGRGDGSCDSLTVDNSSSYLK